MKVGEYDTEEYTVTGAGMTMHLWVAPSYPNAKAVKDELSKMSKAMSTGLPDPNSFDLPGLVVKMDADMPTGKLTTTLQSAKQQPVDAGEFAVPPGYNTMQMPAGFGLGK